jgi:hypothetical protein
LDETGACDARHGLTGRIGHEMDVKIPVGHGSFYPTATPGEMRDWSGHRGDNRDVGRDRPDSGHDSRGPSDLSSPADSSGRMTCESGIRPLSRVESVLSDPQPPGDR